MSDVPDLPRTEAAIIELTNTFRQENRLRPVARNKQLEAAARWYAAYLARTGKFAHEADGRHPHERVAAQGYKYCLVSENLALNLNSRGFTSSGLAMEVVEGWKKSPDHRENLEEPDATDIGVATARVPDKHPKFVSVQLFGRPETLKIEFRIRNETEHQISYTLGEESQTLDANTTATHEYCQTAPLKLERAGRGLVSKALNIEVEPRDGAVFTLITGTDGRIRVDTKDGAAR